MKALIAKLENPVVVDIRKTEDHANATEGNVVPGSINVPYNRENNSNDIDQLEKLGVAKDAAVLVVVADMPDLEHNFSH